MGDVAAETERLAAAEHVCWELLWRMALGTLDARRETFPTDAMQTWANLAARDGILHDDDPTGRVVSHAVPYPHGASVSGGERP